ncbi:MAG: hypothetical protein KBE65_11075 [Phycisphaerae bacterium]|nr:hypothetical protein [Phycisphaerae bacterium]
MRSCGVERMDMGENEPFKLPACAEQFIAAVVRQIRYRKRVREDVRQELAAHFEDELRDCADALEREQRARQLIEDFGDAKLLAVLCRRAKKRCRPLWGRAWARMMQAVGVFLLVFVPYTIWFISGKPNPTIDYLPQLNALHRPSGPAKDNAWPYYERAMRLVVEPNETVQNASWFKYLAPPEELLTPQDRKVVEDWIADNPLAWLQFEFGSVRGYCHRAYRRARGTSNLLDVIDNPPPVKLRRLAQLGLWKSRLAVEQGRTDDALACCMTILHAGAHWQTNAFLIEQLVGQAIGREACREILRIVAAAPLSVSELSDLETRLLQVYPQGYLGVHFEGERLMTLDMVQYCFTSGGPGGGHRVAAGYVADLKAAVGDSPPMPDGIATSIGVGLSMFHASRNNTVAKVDRVNKRLRETTGLSPYERRAGGVEDLVKTVGGIEMYRYALVYTLLPAERRVSELTFQRRADYEALLTVIAAKRYCLEKGSYPPDLETLVRDAYLREVPMDPYSGAPLVYRRTTDGFILYSVGRDFIDNGGEPSRDKDGLVKPWRDNGDTVFWPVGP